MVAGKSDAPVTAGAGDATHAATVAIIGAGPAGLAAAVAAADAGASVLLVDSEPGPGGQFWRHPAPVAQESGAPGKNTYDDSLRDSDVEYLHHDLGHYRQLRGRWDEIVAAGRGGYRPRCEVWAVEKHGAPARPKAGATDPSAAETHGAPTHPGASSGPLEPTVDARRARFTLHLKTGGASDEIAADAVVLATGAYDLQLPFEGWDLPGVMTAGGVQSLLKGHGVLAGQRVAVAGTGPFLLSVASGLARTGAEVVGVFEAAPPRRWAGMARASAMHGDKVAEAAGYARDFARYRVPVRTGWTVLRAHPSDSGDLTSVTVAPIDTRGAIDETRSRTVDVDVLAVGWGFVPRVELAVASGCATEADPSGLPVVVVDAAQRTTVPGVYAAGEVCGVGGAALALAEGEIAGTVAALESIYGPGLGAAGAERRHTSAVNLARALRKRARMRRFAAALARSYPVPTAWREALPPDTVVCRCEEVTAAQILAAARRYGAADARTVKLLARPGMGWCQGRICGYAVEELTAHEAGERPMHRPANLPVAFPVPLGQLAMLPKRNQSDDHGECFGRDGGDPQRLGPIADVIADLR